MTWLTGVVDVLPWPLVSLHTVGLVVHWHLVGGKGMREATHADRSRINCMMADVRTIREWLLVSSRYSPPRSSSSSSECSVSYRTVRNDKKNGCPHCHTIDYRPTVGHTNRTHKSGYKNSSLVTSPCARERVESRYVQT